jgi:hypothetical protein
MGWQLRKEEQQMIFITHPEHGADNISESDLAEREKAGWLVTTRAEWMGEKHAGEPAGQEEPPVAPKKRGPKPKGL